VRESNEKARMEGRKARCRRKTECWQGWSDGRPAADARRNAVGREEGRKGGRKGGRMRERNEKEGREGRRDGREGEGVE